MMDLLVQATTINKISPGGHIINVISKDERNVNYKPNTPIGSLDANTVYIIPKSTLELPVKRMPKLANQPFEQTFRLQVNLPHNQRMVLRVSPRITLAELKSQICADKELDHSAHHLVHPAQPDTILDLNATLDVYGCAEITLMSNSGLRDSIRNTSTNIFPIPKIEEERKKKGILRLFSRKKKDFSIETTNGSLPTSHSDTTLNRNSTYQPKASLKRKPAPAPPPAFNSSPPLITQSSNSINSRPESEISVKTADEIESSVSHSRHSSDSSGYHEPSVFSDCSAENKSPEASIVHDRQSSPLFKDYPENGVTLKRSSMTARDTSNLKHVPSCSNVSISSASRKRKAPQPPISTLPAIESPSSPDNPPTSEAVDRSPRNSMDGSTGIADDRSPRSSMDGSLGIAEDRSPRNSMDGSSRNVVNRSPLNGTGKSEEEPSVVSAAAESERQSASDSVQQESEALQYLEDVLQESEKNCVRNFSSQRVLDDSDTDSLKDEGEVISVCQAEIHANDQDSSDSIVEPPTVVIPDPALPKSSLSAPYSQPEPCEVVDPSADDSGICHSLPSDADSSVPSINSDLRPDSGMQEDIYCNVTDSLDSKSVPSSGEFNVEGCNVDVENRVKTDSLKNNSIGESSSTYPSTTINATESTSTVETASAESVPIVPVKQNSSTTEMPPASDKTIPVPPAKSSGQENDKSESKCDNSNSDRNSVTSSLSMDSAHNSTTHTPQLLRKLDNFALGCYRKEEDIDIYSVPSPEHNLSNGVANHQSFRTEIKAPARKAKIQPDVKISSFKERNPVEGGLPSENGIGKVSEKCAQLSNISTLPLTGRSTSLFNLTPQKKFQRVVFDVEESEETVNGGGMKRTHSDQNVAKDLEPVELKETFLNEQRRLHEEYRRLQEQFISWQKQLLSNQSLLQNEKIVPQMPFPSLEGLTSLDSNVVNIAYENTDKSKSDTSASFNDLRTRSLPRPKTKPLSLKEPSRPKSPPIAQSPTEVSVVDIDINEQEPAKRPGSLNSCSVNTQADFNQDKVTQVPSPQDKNTQVPSPQEKVTSSTQAPSPPNVLNKDTSAQTSENVQASDATDVSSNSLSSPESETSKSQTLPRQKPTPISAFQPSRTMTLNRNTRPKTQAVSVTIGSWQQRQTAISEIEPSNNVASTRSKFLSLENIPQSSMKSVPSTMERRKLPPVPIEVESPEETVPKTLPKFVEAKTVPKAESVKPKSTSTEVKSRDVDRKPTRTHSINDTEVLKTVPKQIDEVPQKPKSDIRLASREPTATFKLAKPFVKLSSMKDEPHQPSIIGLRKWPLADSDSKQSSILDDLKASSKKPGGFVQEKIRRAEVDLRKPKSKAEPAPGPKPPKQDNPEASKLHITKVSINNNPKASAADSNETQTLVKTTNNNTLVKTTNNNTLVKTTNNNTLVKTTNNSTLVKTTNSTPAVTTTETTAKTVPKSKSLNSELMSVFSKKASRDVERSKAAIDTSTKSAQVVTVNGGVQQSAPPPPPPPPPPMASSSTMPTIPPAEQIPVSSQLVMARGTKTLPRKESKKSPTKFSRTSDPREELMLEIRGFGGKQALRKAPSSQAGFHLKVFGTATKANM